MTSEATVPTTRWFLIIPIPAGAEAADMLAEHPNAWVLDSTTGVMTSPAGWSPKTTAPKAA